MNTLIKIFENLMLHSIKFPTFSLLKTLNNQIKEYLKDKKFKVKN